MEDVDYFINQLGLDNLTKHGNNWNFRCNVCGDSRKSLTKKRGWIFVGESSATFYCHNCGIKLSFEAYLKEIGEMSLLDEYINDRKSTYIKSRVVEKVTKKSISSIKLQKIKYRKLSEKNFKPLVDFPEHLQYMKNRKVPEHLISSCYVYVGDKWYKNFIIIPFLNNDKLYGFQGRGLKIKNFYISKLNDVTIWNYFNVDNDQVVYILEGFFDAMHVRNSVATLGASKNMELIKKIKKRVWIFDQDERGYQDSLKRAEEGEKICLLWKYPLLAKYKDINKYICETGDTDIMTKILNSIYSGLDAVMELFKIKRQFGYSDVTKVEDKNVRQTEIDKILNRK